jgi:hypothetical protein
MPNRILREGILESERVDSLSAEGEVFYRRLMSRADDYGRYYAHPKLLLASLYPLRLDRISLSNVSAMLAECAQAGLIVLYEVGGKNYLEISNFGQRARTDSKFPAPCLQEVRTLSAECAHNDGEMSAECAHVAARASNTNTNTNTHSHSASAPPSNMEVGFVSLPEKTKPLRARESPPQRFDEFWGKYPWKEGKDLTAGVYLGCVTLETEPAVFACLDRYLKSRHVSNGAVKKPNNWLHDCHADNWNTDWIPEKAPERVEEYPTWEQMQAKLEAAARQK